jgi:aryl-alcohol dehydrogenase-like predicted oxidoreductase
MEGASKMILGQSLKNLKTLRALDTLVQFKDLARFDTLQAYYSIADRDLEREIIPLLESEKLGLLVWSPLAGGLLSGKFSRTNQKPADSRRTEYDFPLVEKERTCKILEVMAPIAKAHECSPARLSLAWLLPSRWLPPSSLARNASNSFRTISRRSNSL